MFSKGKRSHTIDFLFPIILLLVFALSALVVMLFSANIYSHTVDSSSRNNNARTSISYVIEKVHQSDDNGKISEGELDGCEALLLERKINGEKYTTYIYCHDGKLKELFVKSDYKASADDGTLILEVKDLSIEKIRNGLFRISCTDTDGNTASSVALVRSSK